MSLLSCKTYVSQVGGFQELLRRSRTKVEQIGRSETQDPGVDFVSHLWENPNKYVNTDTSNATNACGHLLCVLLHCSLSYSTTVVSVQLTPFLKLMKQCAWSMKNSSSADLRRLYRLRWTSLSCDNGLLKSNPIPGWAVQSIHIIIMNHILSNYTTGQKFEIICFNEASYAHQDCI